MEKLKNEVWTWTGIVGNEAAINRDQINTQEVLWSWHSHLWDLGCHPTASPATLGKILDSIWLCYSSVKALISII